MLKRYFFLPVYCALLWLMPGSAMSETISLQRPTIKAGLGVETRYGASLTDTEIAFQRATNALLEVVGEEIITKSYTNSETLIEDFKKGNIDVIVIDSLSFLELDDIVPPERCFLVQIGPSLKQRVLILERKKDTEAAFQGLRGGKLSVGGGRKVGKRFLDVFLLQQGLPISDQFFSEIDTKDDINTAIIDLYFGRADVAVVPQFGYALALELNPQLSRKIKVVATSDQMINEIVGVRHGFPQERLDRIRPYLLKVPSKRMELLFSVFHITGFYAADKDSLREVRELNEKYQELVGKER
jgi:ABC-type amino acid transport substrate-binding protein